MTHDWTDRISEYIDGTLDAADRAAVERHLADCESCSGVLRDLEGVVERARSLTDGPPPRDLWAEIERAIAPGRAEAPVIELASRRGPTPVRGRRVNVSVSQLVAAGLALVFLSGAGTLLLRPDPTVPAGPSGQRPTVGVQTVGSGPGPTAAQGAPSEELIRLENLLAAHRGELSPNTVRILEKNLAAIDRAIAESVQALAVDPGNTFLEGHLERAQQRKLEYLREASTTFQWST